MGKRKHIDGQDNGVLSRFVKRRLAIKNSKEEVDDILNRDIEANASEATTEFSLNSKAENSSKIFMPPDKTEDIDNDLQITLTDEEVCETREISENESSSYSCEKSDSESESELYIGDKNFYEPSQYLPLLSLGFYFKNKISKKAFHQTLKLMQIATQDNKQQLGIPCCV
ncbi:hypothetical protein OUZ56_003549 [Daphnia magna]|uniref:Uncharacterized protein n=1 Tax=Daphnia magna TaxID=35525 RepID=A0ABR0A9C0_9CRUS|nr:hypothetical protein OUZ56_003549 [Daphnia magna]